MSDHTGETWRAFGEYLSPETRSLGLLDTPEGFRILLQQPDGFVYVARAKVLGYVRETGEAGMRLVDQPWSLLRRPGDLPRSVVYEVHNSTWIAAAGPLPGHGDALHHYAFFFQWDERIDVLTVGEMVIKAGGLD